MTEVTYLVLHKVRGEPAFDIAIQMEVDAYDSPWWIIPTSGHRAYPHRSWRLDDLADISDINGNGFHDLPANMDDIPDDLPDHCQYDIDQRAAADKSPVRDVDVQAALAALMKPQTPLRRRL